MAEFLFYYQHGNASCQLLADAFALKKAFQMICEPEQIFFYYKKIKRGLGMATSRSSYSNVERLILVTRLMVMKLLKKREDVCS